MLWLSYMKIEDFQDEKSLRYYFLDVSNLQSSGRGDLCEENDFVLVDEAYQKKTALVDYEKTNDRKTMAKCMSRAGEALARILLQKATGHRIFAKDFSILRDQNGKPFQTTVPGLYFNYSHSEELIACGISDQEIGVDIQKRKEGISCKESLVRRVFHEEELRRFQSENDHLPCLLTDEEFTKVWAQKESYLKLSGEGLRVAMSSLWVEKMKKEGKANWFGGKILDNYWLSSCFY